MSKRDKGIHSLKEIPELFGGQEELIMGFTRKRTPERLDKIVEVIWLYQLLNKGETPTQAVIANELGIVVGRIPYYLNMLIEENRVERISIRPARLRIIPSPKNRKPCAKAKRIFDEMTVARVTIPSDKVPTPEDVVVVDATPEQLQETAEALTAAIPAPSIEDPAQVVTAPEERLAAAHRAFAEELAPTQEVRRTYVPERSMNWREAEHIIASHGGNLHNIATSFIINTAKDGDLLAELLDRGYTILKTNPSRR